MANPPTASTNPTMTVADAQALRARLLNIMRDNQELNIERPRLDMPTRKARMKDLCERITALCEQLDSKSEALEEFQKLVRRMCTEERVEDEGGMKNEGASEEEGG